MDHFDENGMRGVTVTGPPGVGTSVFMAYFFLHHKLKNPDTTVTLMFYNETSGLDRVTVYTDGDITELATADVDFLLDGPPDKEYWMAERYVVFTSPNDNWSRIVMGKRGRTSLCMPLWDVPELKTAVEALELGDALGEMDEIPDFPRRVHAAYADEVEYRFAVFGGVASPCLLSVPDVMDHFDFLVIAAENTDKMTAQAVLKQSHYDSADHRLYHRAPPESGPKAKTRLKWKGKPASLYVTLLMQNIVRKRSHDEMLMDADDRDDHAMFMYRNDPDGGTSYGHKVEKKAHKILGSGTMLIASRIASKTFRGTPAEDLKIKIHPSEQVGVFDNDFDLSHLQGGPYFRPKSRNFESIDSFYLIKANEVAKPKKPRAATDVINPQEVNEIQEVSKPQEPWGHIDAVLFQITVGESHPIKARGLRSVLKMLGIDDYTRVALVFALPEDRVENFKKKQSITATNRLDKKSSLVEVDGIGVAKSSKLRRKRIRRVRHLRNPPDLTTTDPTKIAKYKAMIKEARALVKKHKLREVVIDSPEHKALQAIPQFKWIVD